MLLGNVAEWMERRAGLRATDHTRGGWIVRMRRGARRDKKDVEEARELAAVACSEGAENFNMN
jgi:hypothetical protein